MILLTITSEQMSIMIQDAVHHGIAEYSKRQSAVAPDRWFSIKELSEYLPGNPAITTLYGKVQRREIPFKKMGKRLVFLQSEIDQWLKEQHRKTQSELTAVAEQYLSSTRKRK